MASHATAARAGTPRLTAQPPHRANVTEFQLRRIIGGLLEALEDTGWPQLTVEGIVSRAHVSRRTFYDLFIDREDCLMFAFEETIERARVTVTDAQATAPDWRAGTRAALRALLEAMDADRVRARLCVVDALAAGDRVLNRREEIMSELAAAIDAGREAPGAEPELGALTAEGLVGAVAAVLHSRLVHDDAGPLIELLDPLMSMITLPYLGAQTAQQEIRRRPARTATPRARPARNRDGDAEGLTDLNVRVTYRTMRVLAAIGARPGASNRQVATDAGITDQGQISKLLSRLAGLELIENHGAGPAFGAANEWHLTTRGEAVTQAIRTR